MRLFPNFFLWYFSTTKQYLFILICTGWYDVPFSWNKIARKHGRHGQNLQPRFPRTESLFQVKTWVIFRDIIRYSKHVFGDLKKIILLSCRMYVVFRLPVSCAQFHCSSTFLHGIRQIPARFIKTVMFSCQDDSFMLFSWMWRIALNKHYNSILCCHAGMTKFTLGCSTTE